MQQSEDIVTRADEFIEENQELVRDAVPNTLGRIVQHGAPIAMQLSESVTERSRLAVDATNALTAALNGKQATPKEMYRLEVLHKARQREYERVNEAMGRFISFLEGVTDLLNAPEADAKADTNNLKHLVKQNGFVASSGEDEENGVYVASRGQWVEPGPSKPSLWRRLFP